VQPTPAGRARRRARARPRGRSGPAATRKGSTDSNGGARHSHEAEDGAYDYRPEDRLGKVSQQRRERNRGQEGQPLGDDGEQLRARARLVTGRRLAPGDSTDHTSGQAIGAKDVLVSEDTLCRGVHKMV
jgi:hypothetical protein